MITVKTEQYEFGHGHSPRGKGYWHFKFPFISRLLEPDFVHIGSYAEAKKAAIKKAKEYLVTIIEVLP